MSRDDYDYDRVGAEEMYRVRYARQVAELTAANQTLREELAAALARIAELESDLWSFARAVALLDPEERTTLARRRAALLKGEP